MEKKRIYWLDILRITAIFFVISQHTISLKPLIADTGHITLFLMSFLVCGVPLFIAISGSLLLDRKESYKDFYIKRFGRIMFPWIFWCLVYFYWEIFLGKIKINFSAIREFYVFFMSRFWFMPLISVIYLVTPILRIFILNARKKDIEYLLILWLLLVPIAATFFAFIGSSKPPPNSALVIFIGYFVLGHLLMKLKRARKIFVFSLIVLICNSIISTYLVISGFLNNEFFPYSYYSLFVVISTASIFLIIKEIFYFFNPSQRAKKIVVNVSGMSLGIYLVHEMVLAILRPFIGVTENIMYVVPVFLISIFLVFILRRIFGPMVIG